MNTDQVAQAKAKYAAWAENRNGCRQAGWSKFWNGQHNNSSIQNGPAAGPVVEYDRVAHQHQFSGLPVEERAKAEWARRGDALENEGFSGPEAFAAYLLAEEQGLVRRVK